MNINPLQYNWAEGDYTRLFYVQYEKSKKGITGAAFVAILEENGHPKEDIELSTRNVEIEGQSYPLKRRLTLSQNSISEDTKSVAVNIEGDIDELHYSGHNVRSTSRVSLHGIEVPTSLFPDGRQFNQATLTWPLPVILVIDISSPMDLDLNSPRTQIIHSDKWNSFEKDLSKATFQQVADQVSPNYWNTLREILMRRASSQNFRDGLAEVAKIGQLSNTT